MNSIGMRIFRRQSGQQPRGCEAEHEQWGLTPAKLRELKSELDDHLHCLQSEEGRPAAHAARERIGQPRARRALAAPHLSDQVYATLNRWPTRHEWRELATLGIWYALIILSDVLALSAGAAQSSMLNALRKLKPDWSTVYPLHLSLGAEALLVSAWLLQALARAGFFVTFAASLWRAWKIGRGVCLARILQLKLIHTLLVVGALLLLGSTLWDYWFEDTSYKVALPTYLTAPYILAIGLLIAVVAVAISRGRAWRTALFAALSAVFMWAGGPVLTESYQLSFPILHDDVMLPNGERLRVPSDDSAKIAKAAQEQLARYDFRRAKDYDIAHNRHWVGSFEYQPIGLLNLFGRRSTPQNVYYPGEWQSYSSVPLDTYKPAMTQEWVKGPAAIAGGGLGWLAVPIPFLAVIGLLGMLFVMGRRSVFDMLVYAAVCFLAIASTLFPFLAFGATIDITKFALQASPFPGFEMLLIGHDMVDSWLLIVGLVLSAGIPWLLTGLFLRPRQADVPPDSAELAQ